MSVRLFEDHVELLKSKKITERRKACEFVDQSLNNREVIEFLNDDGSWQNLLFAVQDCLAKDVEKIYDDIKKKRLAEVKDAVSTASDLLLAILRKNLIENGQIDAEKVLGYVVGCLKNPMTRKCFEKTYLVILKDIMLEPIKNRAQLLENQWECLLDLMKELYNIDTNVFDIQKLRMRCLVLIVKYAPLFGLPYTILRNNFPFITTVVQNVRKSDHKILQEDVLELAMDFCKHTVIDCRISCCKFGEDTFWSLVDLYEMNGREDKIKVKLLEFFLLQAVIHHPQKDDSNGYAFSVATWNGCLVKIHSVLFEEVRWHLNRSLRNESFFITNNDITIILKTFVDLFVIVSYQLFKNSDPDRSYSMSLTLNTQESVKKQKLEVNMKTLINLVLDTKKWPWITLTTAIMEVYPNLVDRESLISLLGLYSTILVEDQDLNMKHHIFESLNVVETLLVSEDNDEVDAYWKSIAKYTLMSMNQTKLEIPLQRLVRKLLIRKNIVDTEMAFQNFMSMTTLTENSLRTVDVLVAHLNFPRNSTEKQERIAKWLLTTKNFKLICDHLGAKILTNLCLRQIQQSQISILDNETNKDSFQNIREAYSIINLDATVNFKTKNCKNTSLELNENFDESLLMKFVQIVDDVSNNTDDFEIKDRLCFCIFILNFLDVLISTIKPSEIVSSILLENLSANLIKIGLFFSNRRQGGLKIVGDCANSLNVLLQEKNDTNLNRKIREIIPLNLLEFFFEVLKDLEEDNPSRSNETSQNVRRLVVKALCTFGFVLGPGKVNKTQLDMLEVLLDYENYDYSKKCDYDVVIIILNSLKHVKGNVIPGDIIKNIVMMMQNLCEIYYQIYDNSLEILQVLNNLYVLVPLLSEDDNSVIVSFLKVFFENRQRYGPDVSIAILECIEQLYIVDPVASYARWDTSEVIKYVPEFLLSDCLKVRLKAIQTLVVFFESTSRSKTLNDLFRQEMLFYKILETSLKVFDLEEQDDMTAERKRDETMSRSASVLYTFASIMTTNTLWIEDSLIALFRIVRQKKIGCVERIISLVEDDFSKKGISVNLLERYLEVVFEKWLENGNRVEDLPFGLLGCQNKIEFYVSHMDICYPLLLETDQQDLQLASRSIPMVETKIVESYYPKIFALIVSNEIENLDAELINRNRKFKCVYTVLSAKELNEILRQQLDKTLLNLIDMVTDEDYMRQQFNETAVYLTKKLNYQQFCNALDFLKLFVCKEDNLIKYIINEHAGKMERILTSLKSKIYSSISDNDAIKNLHHYVIMVNLVLENLHKESHFANYFIRDVCYTLVHLFQKNASKKEVCGAVSTIFLNFVLLCLKQMSSLIEVFSKFVINSLKDLNPCDEAINRKRLEIISLLTDLNMDTDDEDNTPDLEKTIKDFLDIIGDDCGNAKKDDLKKLKDALCTEKVALTMLYEKLKEIRGFSEDCEESLLHRLVASLIKISCGSDKKVKTEAVKCLGELGPANLLTMVLQPERGVVDWSCTPFEIVCGKVVSLLTAYIVDPDINVVQLSTDVLYSVMESKEARKIAGSEKNFGHGKIEEKYLTPFVPVVKSNSASCVSIIDDRFVAAMRRGDIWCPKIETTHTEWIINLTIAILQQFVDKCFLPKLIPLCRLKPQFCEELLPLLIYMLIHVKTGEVIDVISNKVMHFFDEHWKRTVLQETTSTSSNDENVICLHKKSVRCMLYVVHFYRIQKNFSKSRKAGDLTLDYLKVSQAAQYCHAHFTALLYAELWCQSILDNMETPPELLASYTKLDLIYEKVDPVTARALYNILRNAYKAIGEVDAIPGCGTTFLLDPKLRVEHYKDSNQWDRVAHYYEMQVSRFNPSSVNCLMDTFKQCSSYEVPLLCTKYLEEPQYECFWRLTQWDVEETGVSFEISDCLEKHKYFMLKALHERDYYSFQLTQDAQMQSIIEKLRHTSLEGCRNVYPILSQLQSLLEAIDFSEAIQVETNQLLEVLTKWKQQDILLRNSSFEYIEPIIAQRTVILKEYLNQKESVDIRGYLADMMLEFAGLARQEKQHRVAARLLANLHEMQELGDNIRGRIGICEAQLCWSLNDKLPAWQILKELGRNENTDPSLRAEALQLSGQWMVETYSENRQTIITEYFFKSLQILGQQTHMNVETIVDSFDRLASFADREYQQIADHMKSDEFKRKVANIERSLKKAEQLSNMRKKKTREEEKAEVIHRKQSDIDRDEVEEKRKERDNFLQTALKYYFKNLQCTDKNNMKMFRVMSLILENRSNAIIRKIVEEQTIKVPSYKFVDVLPQIVPHLTDIDGRDLFADHVATVVKRCAMDHPHHALPLLFALANANADRQYADAKTSTSSNEERVTAAVNMLDNLEDDPTLSELVHSMRSVAEALIELAYYEDKSSNSNGRRRDFEIPRRLKISKLRRLDQVLVPTVTLPVSKNKAYEDLVVGIHSFNGKYNNVGGINAPKMIKCRGTDGRERSQLLKGKDDLRQDSVMQQVFTIMNSLLGGNKHTLDLKIRTYKIVPLSMRSGILEWVENSMPIGEYLVGELGTAGAHMRYRTSGDFTSAECRSKYRESVGKSAEMRLRIFRNICQHFRPAMHHFFVESFPSGTVWYERRRAYSRSVATTSMCGYVLGIGDRHVSNVLLDKHTAELIHIDFGIAFEQGRCLPTPETVPFRLTRDIVDGMGISGVEGVFKRSCEKTMQVLRDNSQTILTILEVLLYDPLYTWSVSPAEANKRQTDEENVDSSEVSEEDSIELNITAERALLRMRCKLQGTEGGNQTSIEHQVGTLIQQAMDPTNLCRLFHGWQPYI